MMLLAGAIGALCTTSGIFLSYGLADVFGASVPPGPLVILEAILLYAVSAALRRARSTPSEAPEQAEDSDAANAPPAGARGG